MTHDDLALLRSLATRPSRNLPQCIHPMVAALVDAGYVSHGPDGWITTERGCSLLTQERAPLR